MLEEFKQHPMVAPLIKDGQAKEYMAHWVAEGGYETIPQLCGDGYLIAGDSGMLFNALHREGSNMAMPSGSFAAQEMLTVDGVPKKEKQKAIWKEVRKEISLFSMIRLL